MTPEKIKEFALKMEGVADGIKFGVNQTLQWVAAELGKERAGTDVVPGVAQPQATGGGAGD